MNGYLSEKDYHETVHPEHTLVQKQAAIIECSLYRCGLTRGENANILMRRLFICNNITDRESLDHCVI